MTRVFWDTNLFIYFFESKGVYTQKARQLRKQMQQHQVQLVTSSMTLGEIQVGPRRAENFLLADQYKAAISRASQVVDFNSQAADAYAFIRQTTSIKGPDAIHLACASASGTEAFVTNDKILQKVKIPGIHFIISLDAALHLFA